MKKNIYSILFSFAMFTVNAQQEKGIVGYDNWLDNWTEFKPNKTEKRQAKQILAGNISINTKLVKNRVYLLMGDVYVTNKAVLTIEPGTVILGDFKTKGTLTITKGAAIIANGTETDPIIFTSNSDQKKPGDWGGIIILGDAPINKFGNGGSYDLDLDPKMTTYGGNNSSGSSGILTFVRIEFAGKRTNDLKETFNALTIAGVGNKTILENIMVSNSGGDSFAFFGGNLAVSKLISYKSMGNDYKFTQGVQCQLSNSLAIRSPYLSTNERRYHCIVVKANERKGETDFTKKQTALTASNITILSSSENTDKAIQIGLVKEAIYINENTSFEMKNSIISGFKPAVLLNDKIVNNSSSLKNIKINQTLFNLCNGNIFTENNPDNEDLENWYGNPMFSNAYSQIDNKDFFIDALNMNNPDYRIQLSKITSSITE